MFASQAALVIANARTHREERQARADLETLVNTSPVGVVVFDARTGGLASVDREAIRVVDGLREGEQHAADLLEVVTCVRSDGREFSLKDFTLAELLSAGETVRAEEIALRVPDGRSVSVLLNATPIHSEDGQPDVAVCFFIQVVAQSIRGWSRCWSATLTLRCVSPALDMSRLYTGANSDHWSA